MKKIILFVLLTLMIFSLFACAEPKVEPKEDEIIKEAIDFPYCIKLELRSMEVFMREIRYDILINSTEDSVELIVKYNNKDHKYFPEGTEDIFVAPDKVYILKYYDRVCDYYVDHEEYKNGKEIIEIDLTPDYKHTEKINLSKEQYEEISDIIAKIQSYEYDADEEGRPSGSIIEFPYSEDVYLSVQNVKTGEKNEINCKYAYCEYALIYDEYLKELIKKMVEISPVPIVSYNGKPLRLDDSRVRFPPS